MSAMWQQPVLSLEIVEHRSALFDGPESLDFRF